MSVAAMNHFTVLSDDLEATRTKVYPVSSTGKTTDPFETNTELARLFLNANSRIVVSWNSTRWVYELFPALLVARYGSSKLTSYPAKYYRG